MENIPKNNSSKSESSQENHISTAANQKITEYINRINNGESKDSIFQGLPESFKTAIEQGLQEQVVEEKKEEAIEIPSRFQGLDSETLDHMWTFPIYIDEEKNKENKDKKERILAALRQKESMEDYNLATITSNFNQIYSRFSQYNLSAEDEVQLKKIVDTLLINDKEFKKFYVGSTNAIPGISGYVDAIGRFLQRKGYDTLGTF